MAIRVHELARELGVSSKEILGKLSEFGEFVKSASSTIADPVASRVRDSYPPKPKPAYTAYPDAPPLQASRPPARRPHIYNDPFASPSALPRLARHRQKRPEICNGEELGEFTKLILRRVVRPSGGRGPVAPRGRYFKSDVVEAKRICDEWLRALITMTPEEIVEWLRMGDRGGAADPDRISAEYAIQLHQAGFRPIDLESGMFGRPSIGFRLRVGNMTISEALAELGQPKPAT